MFTVNNCGVVLVVPTSWAGNVRLVGFTVIVPGVVLVEPPVPLNVKVWVPLDSVTVTVAVSVPVEAGVNVTVKVQTIVGGTVAPQVLKSLKSSASGPLTAMLLMSSVFVPFASVTTSVLEVPVCTLPKSNTAGNSCGPAGVAGAILATNALLSCDFNWA